MLLGGAALVRPEGARYLYVGLLTVYELVFVSRLGQTPGKDFLKIKVATTGTTASPALARAARRWVIPLAVLLSPDLRVGAALAVVSLVLVAVVPGRRSGHDVVAGTWVVGYDADAEEGTDGTDFGRLDRLRRERRLFRTDE